MNFYTTILGSGAAVPAHNRHCSGQSLNVNGFYILLDCGENTQTELRIRHQKIQSIPLVCLTHLHGDHMFGLPGLLSTMHLVGRTEPLDIIAPAGLESALKPLLDISFTNIDFEVRYHELTHEGCQPVFDNKKCEVSAFPLLHSVPTYGYLIRQKSNREDIPDCCYAYCTDTGYTETFLPFVKGVDLLCLESTFDDDNADLALKRQHLTASQAATLAQKAGVKQLLLTHFSARYKEIDTLLEHAQAIFPQTIAAQEGERIPIL